MPEVVRGSRVSSDLARPSMSQNRVHFGPESPPLPEESSQQPLSPTESPGPAHLGVGRKSTEVGRKSTEGMKPLQRRQSERPEDRPEASAYYDSRAATKREFKRRASTLQDYYKENPTLLPQLPFTWRHGFRRWKLFALIFLIFVDACVIPIVLYYALKFAGDVEGWLIFAVVASIWGGPTYVEFAVRSWRLIKKEDFFRPLGTKNRWAFDYLHWLSSFAIAAVTAFLIIGSAPHIVWLRILSLPGPALLLVLGVGILWPTVYAQLKKPAPFRISSTGKGEAMRPGVFYICEDVIAVNANAGRPYREAIHARYEASPMFRRMMFDLSWAYSIPAIVIGIILIVLICIHEVDKEVAYGLGWGLPFFWALVWGLLTVPYARWAMARETEAWENDQILDPEKKLTQPESAPPSEPEQTNGALDSVASQKAGESRERVPAASPEGPAEAKHEPVAAPEAQEPSTSTKEDPSAKPPESKDE